MVNELSPVDKVLDRLEDYSKSGGGFRSRCPAHNGNSATSLSITEGDDGRAVLYCHGGCDWKEVVTALGLGPVDLFVHDSPNGSTAKKASKKATKKDSDIEKTLTWNDLPDGTYWEFTSPAGEVLYIQRHKRECYRKVGEGLWKKGFAGTAQALYNLHELVEGVSAGKTVYHLEGPKDVETAREKLGVVATTGGGVKTWRPEFKSHYTGANVVIIPDNDNEGRQYANTVAQSIAPVARSVKVVNLPDLPDKGDLTHWLEACHTA
jgi:hypothetical protein